MAGMLEEEKKRKKHEEPELPKITKVVVPWIRRLDTPEAFVKDYREHEANPALVALYKYVISNISIISDLGIISNISNLSIISSI